MGENSLYGHPKDYFYDHLLQVPLLVRIPGEDPKDLSRPFSLANLPNLITDLIDKRDSEYLTDEGREDSIILSDSISEDGHTVSVRSGDCKYTKHFGKETASHWVQYKGGNPYMRGLVEGCTDKSRLEDLKRVADDHQTNPRDIPSLSGEMDEKTLSTLKDLGYVA